jgi:hypothetical protein
MADRPPVFDEFVRARAEFLKADLRTALTFVRRAATTRDAETRLRNLRNARHAYDVCEEHLRSDSISGEHREAIVQLLKQLRSALRDQGEDVAR